MRCRLPCGSRSGCDDAITHAARIRTPRPISHLYSSESLCAAALLPYDLSRQSVVRLPDLDLPWQAKNRSRVVSAAVVVTVTVNAAGIVPRVVQHFKLKLFDGR